MRQRQTATHGREERDQEVKGFESCVQIVRETIIGFLFRPVENAYSERRLLPSTCQSSL